MLSLLKDSSKHSSKGGTIGVAISRREEIFLNDDALKSLLPYARILAIEAVNWTPWWGGNYVGKSIKVRDWRVEGFSLPTAETVKGVIKWVVRAALSCRYENVDYKVLNSILSPVYGGVIKISDKKEEHFNSLVRLDVEAELADRSLVERVNRLLQIMKNLWKDSGGEKREDAKKAKREFLEALTCLAFSKYKCSQGVLNINTDCPYISRVMRSIGDDEAELLKSYGIPRVALTLLSLEKPVEAIEQLPLPPNSVKVKINVSIDKKLINMIGIDKARDLAYLTSLALVYVLEVHGIGRGSSRGFGRFKVTGIRSLDNELTRDWIDKLEELANKALDPSSAKQGIEEIQRIMSEKSSVILYAYEKILSSTSVQVANMVKSSIAGGDPASHTKMYRVPCLIGTQVEILKSIKHPFPAPIRRLGGKELKGLPNPKPSVTDIYEALSAIGYASLKVLWKVYSMPVLVSSGVRARSISDISGAGYHIWILGLPRWQNYTGYAIFSGKKPDHDNLCVNLKWVKATLEEGRRKSPVILYPLPDGRSAVVLAFKTYMDHSEVLQRLVHVGSHGGPKDECRHVVSVTHIVSNRVINKEYSEECYNCGSDVPGGIVSPQKIGTISNPMGDKLPQVINMVYQTSLEFIKNLLT